MGSIAGIFGKNGQDVSQQIVSMLQTMSHGSPDSVSLVLDNLWRRGKTTADLNLADLKGNKALGQVSSAVSKRRELEQPHFDCTHQLILAYEGQLYNHEEIKAKLAGKHDLITEAAGEPITHLLEEHYQGDLKLAVKETLKTLNGVYALGASDGRGMALARDPVGTKPLYLAEDGRYTAFASEKKALWGIGFEEVEPLRAGRSALFDDKGIEIEETLVLDNLGIEIEIEDLSTAMERYGKALYAAMEKRLEDLDKVGVLVSGGVDSCLMAKIINEIATRRGIEVTVYSAGVVNSPDLRYSENYAHSLGLNHRVRRLDIDEIEAYIPKVMQAVEERDFIQIEAGVGIYAAVEMANQDGIKVIFSGQGPDELWAGYTWYPKVVEETGHEGLHQMEWEDLERVDIETLDRENKIALSQGMEVRFPYADLEVIKVAMGVSPKLKVFSPEDHLGKRPHRELAKRVGVPPEYADRTKDAAQHGTGIHGMFNKIAVRNGFTAQLAKSIGYTSEKITTEKLGSSSRYGYRYGEKDLWLMPDHIQLFLDVTAYKADLLNRVEREKIEYFLKRIDFQIAQ